MKSHYHIAIVGYGPVGATLAALLGQYGLSVLVVDREAQIYNLPRAVHFDDEVMRIFQLAGIADDLLKKVRINPGMRFVDPQGKLLLDWPRPKGISGQGWNTSYRFHQPDLEEILRSRVDVLDEVDAFTSHNVSSVTSHDDHAELQLESTVTGRSHTVRADYVVGCDGARSALRSTIGAEMEDFGFRERWLVVDVELKTPRPDLGDHSIQHCNPNRSATYVRGPGDRRRWELALRPEDEGLDFQQPSTVWKFLKQWISPQDAELERSAVYEFRSVVARQWNRGRVFLAGDAAHQMPPFMGQGMCAGIRDAANLAWKLAACVKDGASAELLQTYASERRPHVREYVQLSIRLGGLINTSKTEEALAAAFPQDDGSTKLKSIAPPLGAGLAASVSDGVDTKLADAAPNKVGHLSQQLMFDGDVRMDDQIGQNPALLLANSKLLTDAEGFAGTILCADHYAQIGPYLADLNAVALLIRPDRYIFGSATRRDALPQLLASWDSAVGPSTQ